MAHMLESNPALVSPEYWDGHDITQAPRADASALTITDVDRLTERLTNRIIRKALQGIVEIGECQELPVPLHEAGKLDILEPVVIETEDLVHYAGIISRCVLDVSTGQENAPSLRRPFTDHWRRFHHRGLSQLGIEAMVLPEANMIYSRTVEWGVTYPVAGNNVAVRTWDFGAPKVTDGRVELARDPKEDRQAWLLHDSLGEVREITIDGPLLGVHILNRVRSIHQLVPRPETRKRNFSHGFTERARRLGERLEAILPKPIPLPGVG